MGAKVFKLQGTDRILYIISMFSGEVTVADQCLDLERKGQAYTRDWMEKNCKVLQVDQNMTHGLAEFGRFHAKMSESGGRVFLGFAGPLPNLFFSWSRQLHIVHDGLL